VRPVSARVLPGASFRPLPRELSDDRLLKAFKAEPKKDGSMISSALVRIKNGVQSSVQFLIDKVSYMPQSCMAP
jgi:hypothetical protein